MNLWSEAGSCLRWLLGISELFFRRRPAAMTIVVLAAAASLVSATLSFVLPLKIVVLVGSEGVSQWFRPYIGPEAREALILGLGIVAVLSFFASIVLDAYTRRRAALISDAVIGGANAVTLVADQQGESRQIGSQLASLLAGALFVAAGVAALALLHPHVVPVLVLILFAEFAASSAIVSRSDRLDPGRMAGWIRRRPKDYLRTLSALNFLLGFGVLLYPLLRGSGSSVIAALIGVIVLRRVLSVIVELIQTAISMLRRRPMIEALVFPEQQYWQPEPAERRSLRDAFSPEIRYPRTQEVLQGAAIPTTGLEVRWQDSRLPGMGLLAIVIRDAEDRYRHYQQQIYLPRHDHRIANEMVLFTHVERRRLPAPRLIARFDEGPFQCQICDAGTGTTVARSRWHEVERQLLRELITLEPPRALVRAFAASHPLLPDRFNEQLLARLEVAVDTREESVLCARLHSLLPVLRSELRRLPLCVRNPEMDPGNVCMTEEGRPLVMTWGLWEVEPLGVGLPGNTPGRRLEQGASLMRRTRADVPEDFGGDHIRLVMRVWMIERNIRANLFKEALTQVQRLLQNPVLAPCESGEKLAP